MKILVRMFACVLADLTVMSQNFKHQLPGKQSRPNSDRVFPVCFSDKHLMNSRSDIKPTF